METETERQQEEEKKEEGDKVNASELRLQKDIKEINTLPKEKFILKFDIDNLKHYDLDIIPDSDSLWYGGKYHFTIDIPKEYPHKSPNCMLKTQIYHPNIDTK